MTNLERSLSGLKRQRGGQAASFRFVEPDKWEDNLAVQLHEESIATKWEGDVLTIGAAEVAYINLGGIVWQVCYQWIPLFRFYSWRECLEVAAPGAYYAIPQCREDAVLTQLGYDLLQTLGFETATFEGF